MGLVNQQVLVKILLLLVIYLAHGRPFEGLIDYIFCVLVAYLLLFGIMRDRAKPILAIFGLMLLGLGHFMPQLAIPEQSRFLMDEKQHLISPGEFLKAPSKLPFSQTADGYGQGFKDKRLVKTIDIDEGILSLRSGWINRPEYNFFSLVSPYVRKALPFVVTYEITPQMVGMTLNVEGFFTLDFPSKRQGTIKPPEGAQKMILSLQDIHTGAILYGFGGQWDEGGLHNLKIGLEKSTVYKFYDIARYASFVFGLGFLFFGLFTIRPTLEFRIQSALLFLSGLSLWLSHAKMFRWGILARGGMDGIIHDGFPYQMLEKWAVGEWGAALFSPERVFYFMPGMRYVRFSEMLLFGDAYIFQFCLLTFVPLIFYRFFSLFLKRIVAVTLTLLTFVSLFNWIGLSLKLYVNSMLDLYGEGVAYALLFISLTLLIKRIQNVGWGFVAFFLLTISMSIRPNLAIFVGILAALHLFTTTFSPMPWMSRFMMLFGLSPILLIPIHNILGGEFLLLSKASQIPENLPLSPILYYQAISYLFGLNESFQESARFSEHFQGTIHYGIAWLGCLYLSVKGHSSVVRVIALATFGGISVHFFCWPDLRYLNPYMTIALVLGLSQIQRFRAKEMGVS